MDPVDIQIPTAAAVSVAYEVEAFPLPSAPEQEVVVEEEDMRQQEYDEKHAVVAEAAVSTDQYTIRRIGDYSYYPVFKFLIYEPDELTIKRPSDEFHLSIGKFKDVAVIRRSMHTRQVEWKPGVFLTELDFFTVRGTTLKWCNAKDDSDKCIGFDYLQGNGREEGKITIDAVYGITAPVSIKPSRVFAWCSPQRELPQHGTIRRRYYSAATKTKFRDSDYFTVRIAVHHVVIFNHLWAKHVKHIHLDGNTRDYEWDNSYVDVSDRDYWHNDINWNVELAKVVPGGKVTTGDYISMPLQKMDIDFVNSFIDFDRFEKRKDGSIMFKLREIGGVYEFGGINEVIAKVHYCRELFKDDSALMSTDTEGELTSIIILLEGNEPLHCVLEL